VMLAKHGSNLVLCHWKIAIVLNYSH